MNITFLGAAGEVTGSQHLIETSKLRILLDCGLFQGRRAESRAKNERFACRPKDVDCVILSHAHIDHCGNLPGLYKAGFRGPIFCTDPTADVAGIMLRDSVKIQAEDVRYLKKHRPPNAPFPEALYEEAHVDGVLRKIEPIPYHAFTQISPEVRIRFSDAGHILGSALTEIEIHEPGEIKRIVFTGDLGRRGLPVLRDPQLLEGCDVLITESTYADRIHPPAADLQAKLLELIGQAIQKDGKIIIPAFSLGRTQNIVYFLNELHNAGKLPNIPIYVDSPLSREITRAYLRHLDVFDAAIQRTRRADRDPFNFPGLTYVATQQESMGLNGLKGPAVIIAASGMCESGRVLHHLKHHVSDARNTILIIGFQAEGTLGRRLVDKQPYIRILEREYPLRAEVITLNGLSAHADADDFRWWIGHMAHTGGIGQAFIVHGEARAAQALSRLIHDDCNHDPIVPQWGQSFPV